MSDPFLFTHPRTSLSATLRHRLVPALLSLGLAGLWLGHGMQAATGRPALVELFVDSLGRLGVTIDAAEATSWVRGIGVFDVALAAVLAVLFAGYLQTRGALHVLAYSRAALVVYGWLAIWGSLLAASYAIAAGRLTPEVWDVIERTPHVALPVTLLLLVRWRRRDNAHRST